MSHPDGPRCDGDIPGSPGCICPTETKVWVLLDGSDHIPEYEAVFASRAALDAYTATRRSGIPHSWMVFEETLRA